MKKLVLLGICILIIVSGCANRSQRQKNSDMTSMYQAERDAVNSACHSDYEKNSAIGIVRNYLPEHISQASSSQLNNHKKVTPAEKRGVEAYETWLSSCSAEKADINRKEGVSSSLNSLWTESINENKRLLNKLAKGQISYGEYLRQANKLLQDTKITAKEIAPSTYSNTKSVPPSPQASGQNAKDRRNAATIAELFQGEDTCPKNVSEPILCKPLSRTMSDLTPEEIARYKVLVKQQASNLKPKERIDMGTPLICGKNVDCYNSQDMTQKMAAKINFFKTQSKLNSDYDIIIEICDRIYKWELSHPNTVVTQLKAAGANPQFPSNNPLMQSKLDAFNIPPAALCRGDVDCLLQNNKAGR